MGATSRLCWLSPMSVAVRMLRPAWNQSGRERISSTSPDGPAYSSPIHSPMKVSPRTMKVTTMGSSISAPSRALSRGRRFTRPTSPAPSRALIRGTTVWEIVDTVALA